MQILAQVEVQQTALANASHKFSELKAELDQKKVEQNELQMKHTVRLISRSLQADSSDLHVAHIEEARERAGATEGRQRDGAAETRGL